MQLSDSSIHQLLVEGVIGIDPRPELIQFQPATLDLRLGTSYYHPATKEAIIADRMTLRPGRFMLGSTKERIALPPALSAQVKGKSTLAREGLLVEVAGFIDPGFSGHITLELKNLGEEPIQLTAGQRICQIAFYQLDLPAGRPYGSAGLGSHYQGQHGATPARRG